jgi:hypothetical protein
MVKHKCGDKIKCAYVGCNEQFEYNGITQRYCSFSCGCKAQQLNALIKRRISPKIIISCEKCNKEFKKTFRYCPYCGEKLEVQEIVKSQQEIQDIANHYINLAKEKGEENRQRPLLGKVLGNEHFEIEGIIF